MRIDSSVFESGVISPYYDSMIAKVIAWAPTREEAIRRMQRALGAFKIEGVRTTVSLHQKLLATEAFRKGMIDTGYLENHLEEILKR